MFKRRTMGRDDGVCVLAEGLAYKLGDRDELSRLLGREVPVDAAGHPRLAEVPLGQLPWLEGLKDAAKWGSINLGGPITTASGLVFIGATLDPYLRAFETATGTELWKGKLPASARSTPMTYQSPKGKQFVVISANGHNLVSDPHDEIVAFALPD